MQMFSKTIWSLQILQTMSLRLEDVPSKYFLNPNNYRNGFVPASDLQEHVSDSRNDLTEEFLNYAGSKGDWCYAIFDDETLASYGWYSRKPTRFRKGLQIEFEDGEIYMYRGYTIDGYRGQRLHAFGMAQACKAFTEQGYRGLVSYVDAKNERSMHSVARLGYVNHGRVFVLRVLGRNVVWTDKSAPSALVVRRCRVNKSTLNAKPLAPAK